MWILNRIPFSLNNHTTLTYLFLMLFVQLFKSFNSLLQACKDGEFGAKRLKSVSNHVINITRKWVSFIPYGIGFLLQDVALVKQSWRFLIKLYGATTQGEPLTLVSTMRHNQSRLTFDCKKIRNSCTKRSQKLTL